MNAVTTRHPLRDWLPPIVWMAIIFLVSTDIASAEHTSRFLVPLLRWLVPDISQAAIDRIHFALRKTGHFCEYAILALLLWRALRHVARSASSRAALVVSVCLAYAALDEFHQSFVPSRTSSSRDVMIDVDGAVIVTLFCLWQNRRNRGGDQAGMRG